jgi:hypothetical protein
VTRAVGGVEAIPKYTRERELKGAAENGPRPQVSGANTDT